MARIDEEIRDSLEAAEKRLRDLIVQAARTGDYDSIDLARMVAGRVREIGEELLRQPAAAQKPGPGAARPPDARGSPAGKVQRKRKGPNYPKFGVENGVLYKVGWSKKRHQEYVHRLPKETYEQIISTIAGVGKASKKLFTSEDVAQELETLGFSVPVYQVYLTLALLRAKQVVERKGREGYRAPGDVVARGMQLWSELSLRNG